jgi:hypothetical protein
MSGSPSVRWLCHTTAMVPSYDLACARLELLGGLRVMEYSENTQPEVGRRGGMAWIGDNSIELGQPIVAGGGAARFVERTGGGMHSVAVQVGDLDETIAHIESCGVAIAARPMPDFCFSDPRDTHGVFFEWAQFELEEDPRFGGELPAYTTEPLFDVPFHAFAGAVVEDPVSSAALFAELMGTNVTFDNPDAGPGEPRVGISMGDCTLALYTMAGSRSNELWGRTYEKPRTHLLGLGVPDLAAAEEPLEANGFAVLRRGEAALILDPASTGGVQVALVDRLLAGDPRLI